MSPLELRCAPLAEMAPATLYRLLALRVDVFVVEQTCPYPELDGRDLETDALQLWAERDGQVVATLRLLRDPAPRGARRIGRVCTAPTERGRGTAAALMGDALARAGGDLVVLDAQAHLQHWYAGFGFRVAGPEFLEDGIPHVPMQNRGGVGEGMHRQDCPVG